MFVRKLVISNFSTHRIRVVLTVSAIALAVSLVVAVTSGYKSVEGAAYRFLNLYMGASDAQISRVNDPHGGVTETVLDELRKDPQVKRVIGRLETGSGLLDASGKPIISRPAQVIGIVRPDDTRVERLTIDNGGWFDGAEGNVVVIDQVAAETLKVKVGDSFALPGIDKQLKLKVVGIVHKPGIIAAQMQTIYVPLHTLQNFTMPDKPRQVTRVMVEFQENVDDAAWATRWTPKLQQIDQTLKLRLASESRKELDKNLQGIHVLSYIGGTVSLLAATFIVFSALSMGVTERIRTLAMLRAIGTQKIDIAKLVMLEGMALALVGALIGAPLGYLWVKILVSVPRFKEILAAGAFIDWPGVAMGVGGSLLAALGASLLPAWSAMRVSPLEAMNPLASAETSRVPRVATIIGFILVCIDPFIMWGPVEILTGATSNPKEYARLISFYGHFVLGLPSLMFGWFLLAPLFVWMIERGLGGIVATMMGVRSALLRQQLSSGIWRAAGTCAALMVGLAILVVMQVQGHTMLKGWKLPDHFPDIFIARPLGGINEAEQKKLADIPGIKRGEIMPIAIASPEFGTSLFGIAGAALIPDATMFFGVDPDLAFKMMDLDFREGNARDATEALKKGRYLIVTEEFRQLKGLHIGDKLPLKTARHGVVDYTICGIVWSPGIDVIVSMFDMGRQFDQRTAASVFGSLADAKEDFGVERIYLFAANLDYFVSREQALANVEKALDLKGMKAGDIRQIKFKIQNGFYKLLALLSTVAFASMLVSSLGVTNTIMASIRTRRWQFGILRSIGLTQGQLLRLVMAEALLIGLVGCGLGLAAGAEMSINARALSHITIGYSPPPAIPWGMIWLGVGIVMFIAIIASLWPAISVSRTEPLALLQAGRSAA